MLCELRLNLSPELPKILPLRQTMQSPWFGKWSLAALAF
jgi:hypothetical protein